MPPSGERAPVLVTNGWVRTAYNVVESLGRRGIPVHVVDRSPRAMCRFSRWTRSFHRVPNFFEEPEAYARAPRVPLGDGALLPAFADTHPNACYYKKTLRTVARSSREIDVFGAFLQDNSFPPNRKT